MSKKHISSSFEDFLKEEGSFEETTTQAVKRVLACDPNNDKVLLETVQRAATAIGNGFQSALKTRKNIAF